MISPCFTSPAGIDFFTAQMMMSPTPATLRLNLPLLRASAEHLDAHRLLGAGVVGDV
jgi:hypothetical protein